MKRTYNKKGFTLLEVLLAVAVIIVLLAVSFISVKGIVKRTNQTKLDSTAQIIYVAAQNRLTELYAAGRTIELGAGQSGVFAQTVQPSDWSGDDAAFSGLCVISSESPAAEKILPKNSVSDEVLSAQWVVEYDAASGNVYSAFFSGELDTDEYYSNQDIANRDIRPSRSARINYGATVGYYGGSVSIGEQHELGKLTCDVELENGEELTAIIKCAIPIEYFEDDVTFYITVRGNTSGNEASRSVTLDYFSYGSVTRVYELTLDSLKDGKSFKENYCTGENALIPGENITVSVTAVSANSLAAPASDSGTANSLFASYDRGDEKAEIACGRHLQNLNGDTSGIGTALMVKSAVQTADISFKDSADGKWVDVYGARPFTPIANRDIVSYNGDGRKITGLSEDTSGNAGIFGTFYGDELKNITLIGASVKGTENIGTIAGETAGDVSITNCRVYLAREDFYSKNAETDKFVSGGKNAGGLVGLAGGDTQISGSFASTVISGSGAAGGLAGFVAGDINVSSSYADCYISGENAGGLAGVCGEGSSFENCYSAGFLLGDAFSAAGFVPSEVQSVKNSYTVFDVGGFTDLGSYAMVESAGVAEKAYYANSPDQGFAGEAISGKELKELSVITAEDKLGGGFSAEDNINNTTAYNLGDELALVSYPYPTLSGMRHYGDWSETEFNPGSLVYFEVYEDGGWGFYGAGKNTLRKTGIAARDGYALIYDSDDINPKADVMISLEGGANVTLSSSENSEIKTIGGADYIFRELPYSMLNGEVKAGKFYSSLMVSTGGTAHYYYFNPHFADTAVESRTEPTLADAADNTIIVRSARQLYLLSRFYPQYKVSTAKCTFLQELNIDYNAYQWAAAGLAAMARGDRSQDAIGYVMGGVDNSFCAQYDGGCHRISGFSVVTEGQNYYGGLFGCISSAGVVKNVVFVSDYDEEADVYSVNHGIKISGVGRKAYIGMIAGVNAGRIENCAAAGLVVNGYAYRNSSIYVGGLVGLNEGTIYSSSADSPMIKLETNNSGAAIGGFVGANDGVIADCYALSYIDIYRFDEGNVQVGGFAGGNGGSISSSYCASALISAGLEGSVNSSLSGFAPDGTAISGCYYLNDGSYRFIDTLYYYSSEISAGVSPKNHYAMAGLYISGFGSASENTSYNHPRTTAAKGDETVYPYPTSVTNAKGEYVHYGEWTFDGDQGDYGFLYWEHEERGSNNGYHFYMVSSEGEMSDTLCTAHADGGVITEYGYGYYEKTPDSVTDTWSSNLNTGYENSAANNALKEQFNGLYTFHVYTTKDAFTRALSGSMYLTDRSTFATVTLRNGDSRTYSFCPFFAASIQMQGTPGASSASAYQVRSVDQLQFINWNNQNFNNSTLVNGSSYQRFTFLQTADSTAQGTQSKKTGYFWTQTHDLEGHGKTGYTPIAAAGTSSTSGYNAVLYGWFGGAYDGRSYTVKNLAISSNCFSVGVFGMTAGADMQNIILYSEEATIIERSTGGSNGAYALGGLIGVAYDYYNSTGNTIRNCSIAGYKIVDNSDQTLTLGEANVGGLIGVANVNLQNCSACVDIEANCDYDGEAQWGNFIRIGGVAGANKNVIANSYSGGTITIADSLLNARGTRGTHVYIGGIAGSGFTSNYVNFTNQTELDDGAPEFYNCYTYMTFPAQTGNIKAISLIGSPADRYRYAPSVTIENCYYLDTIKNIAHSSSNANFEKMLKGDLSFLDTHPVYSLDLAPMTYNQMRDGELQSALNKAGTTYRGTFAPVTVTENGGASIPGKYSFPCGDNELVGENYPFPAIITQTDTFGDTVYVHYGMWHKGSGLYSDRAGVTLDLVSYTGVKGQASYKPDYEITVRLHSYASNALQRMTALPTITFGEEGTAASSNVVSCSGVLNSDGSVSVSVRAMQVGAEIICFSYNGMTTRVEVAVSATLYVKAQGLGEDKVFSGDRRSWALSVFDRNGNEITGLTAANWNSVPDNINIAGVTSITPNDEGVMTLTVAGYGAGATTIRTQCVNVPPADPENTTAVINSNKLMTELTVLRPPFAGLGSSAGLYNQFEVGETARECADKTFTADAPQSGTALFLYATRDFGFDDWEITGWSISSGGVDESGLYVLTFGDIKTSGSYDYRDLTLQTAQKSKIVSIAVTLKKGDAERTVRINYTLPAESSEYTVSYRVDGEVVYTEKVAFDAKALGYAYTDAERTFKQWQKDGEEFNFETALRQDITLDATWEYKTVTLMDGETKLGGLYVSGDSFYSEPGLLNKLEKPEKAVIPAARENYAFEGYIAENGTQFAAADGTISIAAADIAKDMTASAVWRNLGKKLTLSAASSNIALQEFIIANGSGSIDGYTAPTRVGWTLNGWYSAKNGRGAKVVNADGTPVAGVSGYTDSSGKWALENEQTLYAGWKRELFALQTTAGLTNNAQYLIVSENSAGSGYALRCVSNYYMYVDSEEVEIDSGYYSKAGESVISVEVGGDDLVWLATTNRLRSKDYSDTYTSNYLRRSGSSLQVSTSTTNGTWTYSGSTLTNGSRYLYHNGSNFTLINNSLRNVYLYRLQEVYCYD